MPSQATANSGVTFRRAQVSQVSATSFAGPAEEGAARGGVRGNGVIWYCFLGFVPWFLAPPTHRVLCARSLLDTQEICIVIDRIRLNRYGLDVINYQLGRESAKMPVAADDLTISANVSGLHPQTTHNGHPNLLNSSRSRPHRGRVSNRRYLREPHRVQEFVLSWLQPA